jgi:hypothetical protein
MKFQLDVHKSTHVRSPPQTTPVEHKDGPYDSPYDTVATDARHTGVAQLRDSAVVSAGD